MRRKRAEERQEFVVGNLQNYKYDHRILQERVGRVMMMNVARIMILNNDK